jgi:hypothetical protein
LPHRSEDEDPRQAVCGGNDLRLADRPVPLARPTGLLGEQTGHQQGDATDAGARRELIEEKNDMRYEDFGEGRTSK